VQGAIDQRLPQLAQLARQLAQMVRQLAPQLAPQLAQLAQLALPPVQVHQQKAISFTFTAPESLGTRQCFVATFQSSW
jgi:hypothetical protein